MTKRVSGIRTRNGYNSTDRSDINPNNGAHMLYAVGPDGLVEPMDYIYNKTESPYAHKNC